MHYANEVLFEVRTVLANLKERGGLVSKAFIDAEERRLRGQRAADTINVALLVIGKKPVFEGKATPAQMATLVEQAKQQNERLLIDIRQLRAAKGK